MDSPGDQASPCPLSGAPDSIPLTPCSLLCIITGMSYATHHHLDVRAETNERSLLHGPAVFEVVVGVEGEDGALYQSDVLYRTRMEADTHRDELNRALFAALCGFCSASADFIEDIEYMDTLRGPKEFDVIAWCSDACREESLTEDAQLRRAGL